MLAVLSEINCLSQIQSMGVYPDFFSTDFAEFKNHVVTFNNCNVLIILAGINRFYRKHVIELAKSLSNLATNGTSIKKVVVVTDANIPSLGTYYKMKGNLRSLSEYNGWDLVADNSDILESFKSEYHEPITKLSLYDRGIYEEPKGSWVKRKSSEDDLIPLIKIPTLNTIKI